MTSDGCSAVHTRRCACVCSVIELHYRKAVKSDSGAAYILRQLESYFPYYDEVGTGEKILSCPLCQYGKLCEVCYLTSVSVRAASCTLFAWDGLLCDVVLVLLDGSAGRSRCLRGHLDGDAACNPSRSCTWRYVVVLTIRWFDGECVGPWCVCVVQERPPTLDVAAFDAGEAAHEAVRTMKAADRAHPIMKAASKAMKILGSLGTSRKLAKATVDGPAPAKRREELVKGTIGATDTGPVSLADLKAASSVLNETSLSLGDSLSKSKRGLPKVPISYSHSPVRVCCVRCGVRAADAFVAVGADHGGPRHAHAAIGEGGG